MTKTILPQGVKYVGVNDHITRNFENQYPIADGISYNSYVILDQKVAIMDCVDAILVEQWLDRVKNALEDRTPDYLVVLHMEPDHASSIVAAMKEFPQMKIVGNVRTLQMIENFYNEQYLERRVEVKQDDVLELGNHSLRFIFAPMIHWPEVMVAYEQSQKILFSADAFGKFGALDVAQEWEAEARRYYYNIVGKYGANVQALLNKAATLDIDYICSLHGPILSDNLDYYIGKYQQWSKYEAEESGVAIISASIYGNTLKAAETLATTLQAKGAKVELIDITKQDPSFALACCFRYDKVVLACATYDAGLFPVMDFLLMRLASKNFQNRKVALIENGSWAPMAARLMQKRLEEMKGIEIIQPIVSIRSAMNKESHEQIELLATNILAQ